MSHNIAVPVDEALHYVLPREKDPCCLHLGESSHLKLNIAKTPRNLGQTSVDISPSLQWKVPAVKKIIITRNTVAGQNENISRKPVFK